MSIQCPAHVAEDQVREFDWQRDPVRDGADPLDWYAKEFLGKPTFWSPVYGGYWVVTDPRQIREVTSTPTLFSSRNVGLGYAGFPAKLVPIQNDPPDHAKYRRLLAPYFSPRAADALEPAIRAKAIELVEGIRDKGECEFIDAVAAKLPQHIFVTHILHLPPEDVPMFLQWERDLMHHPVEDEIARQSGAEVIGYLRKIVEDRSTNPIEGDFLSELFQAEVDGERMSMEVLLGVVLLLFLAGLDTVTTALTWSFRFLAQNEGHRKQLVDNPGLIPSAVEELLRYHPLANEVRTVVEDIDFHGTKMAAGDRVLALPVLAGRGDDTLENPLEVDFTREPHPHLAFGLGVHRCLGSHLARKELSIVIEEFHRRIPDYELSGKPLAYHAGGVLGINELDLRWTPTAGTVE
jgi:cytochrome P450